MRMYARHGFDTPAPPTCNHPLQVESLRQLGEAAGHKLAAAQSRLEQLQDDKEQQAQQLRAHLQAVQVCCRDGVGLGPSHVMAHLAQVEALRHTACRVAVLVVRQEGLY